MSTEKFYIATPIYYVNDRPHLGHAYTTVAADILARWHKLYGEDVFFLTGADEHGAKVAEAAEKAGKVPQDFCDEMAQYFQKTWQNLSIEFSHFIRTTDPKHESLVIEFLNKLYKKNFFYQKDYIGLYCVGCEKFLTKKELVEGKCPDHNRVPERVVEKNWFFKLREFLPQVAKLILEGKVKIQPETAKAEVLGLFKQNLDDFSISRQKVGWGIKVPWDPDQTFYVWVDALLNYWTALNPLHLPLTKGECRGGPPLNKGERKSRFWPPDLHLIGKDILKFHCIYWPAMLLAYGYRPEELPNKIFVHGYFTINGQKMSKTLGNVIDPNDLVKEFGVDATRYLLFSQFPFGNDGDFSLENLKETYNTDLANGLGNLVLRILKFQSPNPKFQIPTIYFKRYSYLMRNVKLFHIVQLIRNQIGAANSLIDAKKPWEMKRDEDLDNFLKEITEKIFSILGMIQPFMPEISQRIIEMFRTGQKKVLFPKTK